MRKWLYDAFPHLYSKFPHIILRALVYVIDLIVLIAVFEGLGIPFIQIMSYTNGIGAFLLAAAVYGIYLLQKYLYHRYRDLFQ